MTNQASLLILGLMKKRIWFILLPLLAVFFVKQDFSLAQEPEVIFDRPFGVERLVNGNTLIADGGGRDWTNQGSEIIEVDQAGKIVWFYQDELSFAHSAEELANGNLLIVDTTNNRLLEVNRDKEIIWSSTSWPKGKLADGSYFDYPNDAEELANGHFLVTDRNNNRVIEIDRSGKIFWQKKKLNRPHNADRVDNGNTLVGVKPLSDSENDQVIELNPAGQVVWSYDGGEENPLYWPRDVDKLDNGNYLITDTRHHRVIEVTPEGEQVWEYGEFLSFPFEADRLANGHTLISDSSHARVIEVNPGGEIVWEFRNASMPNYGGFERDKDKDGWPDNWLRGNLLAEGRGTFSWDENVFKDGHHSARIDYDGMGMIFWHQYYPVKPGQKYDLIGLIKSQDLEGYARFEVIFVDELGGQVGVTARTPDHNGTTKWTRYETIFTPPEKAVAADIWCLIEGNGTAWFDELSLKQVGWQRILGVKLSLGIIVGGIIIALLLNKLVR